MRFAPHWLLVGMLLATPASVAADPVREPDLSPAAALVKASPDRDAADRIRNIISPRIEGDALVIEGRIDSHIYDYLQYEAAAVAAVKIIDLDSLGGNAEWALLIARKVKDLRKTTLIRSGHSCASACAAIFAAGRERVAAADAFIGIHGARLGAGYLTSFQGLCFDNLDPGAEFEPLKSGCREFLGRWYAATMATTAEAFDIMESNGVSPELRVTYFQMPDDPDWPAELNVIRKPDWTLSAPDAVKYNLVTKVLPCARLSGATANWLATPGGAGRP